MFLHHRKYELLLLALVQHLFIGIFLTDLDFYTRVVWPINMLLLGFGSIFMFTGKHSWRHWFRNVHFIIVLFLPIGIPFFVGNPYYFTILNINYVVFFMFLLLELLRFLIRPGYINTDIISAAACGYFLLIEISVFTLQTLEYTNPNAFKGLDTSSPAKIFIDLVYFCSITFTSIGFGDITPNNHVTKLITSFIGIAGQFYTVVLVGILLSKFTSKTNDNYNALKIFVFVQIKNSESLYDFPTCIIRSLGFYLYFYTRLQALNGLLFRGPWLLYWVRQQLSSWDSKIRKPTTEPGKPGKFGGRYSTAAEPGES